MKHATTALLLALTALLPAQVRENAQAQGTDATAQTLTSLEEKWVTGLVKSDTTTLNSILSDTYVDTDEHGQRNDKQGLLSVLKSGDLKLESIKLSNMQVYQIQRCRRRDRHHCAGRELQRAGASFQDRLHRHLRQTEWKMASGCVASLCFLLRNKPSEMRPLDASVVSVRGEHGDFSLTLRRDTVRV
jgi:hypothetical protein